MKDNKLYIYNKLNKYLNRIDFKLIAKLMFLNIIYPNYFLIF